MNKYAGEPIDRQASPLVMRQQKCVKKQQKNALKRSKNVKKRIKNAAAAHARFRFGERTGTAKRKEKEKNKMKQGKKLLSIMLAMLIAALACGLTGCIKAPGEVASAEATQTPDAALSPEPTLDTTPYTTPDITPGPTPAQSETVQPQDTGAPAPAPGDTGTPTPAPGDTGTPAPGPTVSHAPVSKWDYYVTYGSASIRTVALTRFNDGTQGGGEGSFQRRRAFNKAEKRRLCRYLRHIFRGEFGVGGLFQSALCGNNG